MFPLQRFLILLALLPLSQLVTPVVAKGEEKLDKWKASFEADILPIIQSRCIECHNDETNEGEFNLAPFKDGTAAADKLDMWDRVGKRIRLNEMPPQGSPGLTDPQKGAFYRWLDSRPEQDLCNQLASDETQAWYRGHVMSRRLTRTEYRHALFDLFSVELPDAYDLPSDGSGGEGFDTTGDSLFTSPLHVESYLSIAGWVVEQAFATSDFPSRAAAEAEVARLARRVWRSPVSSEDLVRLMQLYDAGLERGLTSQQAVAQTVQALLMSPRFLFVVEQESPQGGVQRLSPHELAMRLALFIWSSVPDEELLKHADSGALYENEVLLTQVRRMLADPRADRLGENFGLQWLGLADLERKIQPDSEVYPEFDAAIVADMRREAVLLIVNVFREDRSLLELIDSTSVIINERLARLYGLAESEAWLNRPHADPDSWHRIPAPAGERGGVITLGAVLASTSYPRRTSPVLRGQWLLAEVLGAHVPPPPPGVPALEETTGNLTAKTMRERLEVHRENPQCASCHNLMDPLGFGLENYDGLGRWRQLDNGLPIDASGTTPNGQLFSGPGELKKVVLSRQDEFKKHFIRKLLGFALGRNLNKFDQCVIDDCLESLEAREQRAAGLIEVICTSYPFQHRYFKAPQETP